MFSISINSCYVILRFLEPVRQSISNHYTPRKIIYNNFLFQFGNIFIAQQNIYKYLFISTTKKIDKNQPPNAMKTKRKNSMNIFSHQCSHIRK